MVVSLYQFISVYIFRSVYIRFLLAYSEVKAKFNQRLVL